MIPGIPRHREVIRDVDAKASGDLQASRRAVSERFDGRGMGAPGAADSPWQTGWPPAYDRYAGGDERDPVSAAHRLPVALSATRRLPAALNRLQHLPQFPARGRVGGDLG